MFRDPCQQLLDAILLCEATELALGFTAPVEIIRFEMVGNELVLGFLFLATLRLLPLRD